MRKKKKKLATQRLTKWTLLQRMRSCSNTALQFPLAVI